MNNFCCIPNCVAPSNKVILTVLVRTSSGESKGLELTQMPHLVEEVNNLNIKLDAALEFATFLRSVNMIQDFNGIEREEHRREIETFKAIQKLFDITGQGQDTTEDRVAHQLGFQQVKEDMSLRL